jgi:hypothetical protein
MSAPSYFEHNARQLELAVVDGDPRELPGIERVQLATRDTLADEADRLRQWFAAMARKQPQS